MSKSEIDRLTRELNGAKLALTRAQDRWYDAGNDKQNAEDQRDLLIDLLRDISGTLQAADPMKERILETLAKVAA